MLGILALLTLFAQGAEALGPEPIEILSWFSPEEYPAEALRDEAEGSVAFQVEVGANGAPGRCLVTRSSGHSSLDEATCGVVMRRGRFRPAVDARGRPVASTFRSTVSWRIPASPRSVYRATIVDLPVDGSSPRCRVEARGIDPDEARQCASVLRDEEFLRQMAPQYRQLTFLFGSSRGDEPIHPGDPAWGARLGRLVSEQAYLQGSYPVMCRTVAAEGLSAGADACAGFPGGSRRLDAAEAVRARTHQVQVALFGLARE